MAKTFKEGSTCQFALPQQDAGITDNVVNDNSRRSSATAIVFVDGKHFITASFVMKRICLCECRFSNSAKHANLLCSMDATENIDLIDCDSDKKCLLLLVSVKVDKLHSQ